MINQKSEMVSVRMEVELLDLIKAVKKRHDYFSLSEIIRNILTNVLQCSDGGSLFRLISEFDGKGRGYILTFKKAERKGKNDAANQPLIEVV